MDYRIQKKVLLITFLFLPMIFLVIFLVFPTLRMVYYSFTNWDGVLPKYRFIGLLNYKRLFTEQVLWLSLKNNGVYALNGILQNVIAIFFAVLLTSKIRFGNFYKTVIFMPYVLNITAVAYMFNYLYDYREGPINMFVKYLHGQPVKFLSSESLVIFSLAFISMWRWTGYTMILYIAALQSVDREMYEASRVDGATSWQTFRYITLPNIIRIIELNLFLAISGAMQAFTEPLIMTHGGPNNASYTFLYYIIDSSATYNDYGYAAAMSCVLILIILFVTMVQRKVLLGGERT